MQDFISQLTRLYLLDDQLCFDSVDHASATLLGTRQLEQHLLGVSTLSLALLSRPGEPNASGRAIVLDFCAGGAQAGATQWRALCAVANGLRDTLGLPAPAVSISGRGFQLWLSLQQPAQAGRIVEFVTLLRRGFLSDDAGNGTLATVTLLPPARYAGNKWSAFIHPGMGASFADEPYLEMAPPVGAQVGFLEGLSSITPPEFDTALLALRAHVGHDMQANTASALPATAFPAVTAAVAELPASAGLLLKDASLEDIVRHLHALHIEPTFRHLLPPA